MKGSELIVNYLVKEKVPYVFFGPPGHTHMDLLDSMYDKQGTINPIVTRFEVVASFMAEGYYKATSRPGVFSVHYGPGISYALCGVMSAYSNASAVVGLNGDVPTLAWGKQAHHEVNYSNAHTIFNPVTKALWQVTTPEKLAQILPHAFSIAVSGRPGPAILSLPIDILIKDGNLQVPEPVWPNGQPRTLAEPEIIKIAGNILQIAQSPVVLAGAGTLISGATAELVELSELLMSPVATTDSAKGVFPEDHVLSIGIVGGRGTLAGNTIMSEADVILAIGTKFSEFTTSSWEYGRPFRIPPQRLIQVDIHPPEIARNYPVEVGIIGDAKAVLAQIVDYLRKNGSNLKRYDITTHPVVKRIRDLNEKWWSDFDNAVSGDVKPIIVERIVKELRELLPRDGIIVPDSGRNRSIFTNYWLSYGPRTMIQDSGNAAMGYSPAAALGVKLGLPKREVISVSGDGGFLMTGSALATAYEYKIPVKFLVLNDSALQGIYRIQQVFFNNRIIGTTFDKPGSKDRYDIDFEAIGKAFGIPAVKLDDPTRIRATLKEALDSDTPFLIDAIVDRENTNFSVQHGGTWKGWRKTA